LTFGYCNKISEKNHLKKRKGLFWLTVLELSAHGWPDPLLLGLWRGGRQQITVGKKSFTPHLGSARIEKRKGPGFHDSFKNMPDNRTPSSPTY
jgi:hypothetical protein